MSLNIQNHNVMDKTFILLERTSKYIFNCFSHDFKSRFDDEEQDPLFTGTRTVKYHGGHVYTVGFGGLEIL